MADPDRLTSRTRILGVLTVSCYAIGYPIALGAHSKVGWIFVGLGGPFLIALLVTVVQRVHFAAEAERTQARDPSG